MSNKNQIFVLFSAFLFSKSKVKLCRKKYIKKKVKINKYMEKPFKTLANKKKRVILCLLFVAKGLPRSEFRMALPT